MRKSCNLSININKLKYNNKVPWFISENFNKFNLSNVNDSKLSNNSNIDHNAKDLPNKIKLLNNHFKSLSYVDPNTLNWKHHSDSHFNNGNDDLVPLNDQPFEYALKISLKPGIGYKGIQKACKDLKSFYNNYPQFKGSFHGLDEKKFNKAKRKRPNNSFIKEYNNDNDKKWVLVEHIDENDGKLTLIGIWANDFDSNQWMSNI